MRKALLPVLRQLIMIVLFLHPSWGYSAPMDDVFTLLDSGGGVRSGHEKDGGYYIAALGFSHRSSEAKAYEEARLEALRYLNDMVNGITMSGSTYTSTEYVSESSQAGASEYSSDVFREVVDVVFKGHLSAAKTLKKGMYDGQYFVAISISEKDLAHLARLRAGSNGGGAGGTTVVIATDQIGAVADFSQEAQEVEAKGLAPMKHGEQQARVLALQDAMRNAVQQAQGVMLQGKSGAFNEALAFAISTKTEGYVGGYEILDEDISRGNYYVVLLAQVNAGQLLNDVNFYLDILGQPVFSVDSGAEGKIDWLVNELERLGFSIHTREAGSTHTFYLKQTQKEVRNHNGKTGIETSLSLSLKDRSTGEILFTIVNDPLKARIYVSPLERARQVSQVSAYRRLQKQLGPEVIQSLARYAERGQVYPIEIHNARRSDWQLFKFTLENGTGGTVEGWEWQREGKVMVLNYRYSGPLSEAMDQGLEQLYKTYRTEGKGRRPTALEINDRRASFRMVQ